MPPSLICLNSRAAMADIRRLQAEFVAVYDQATNSKESDHRPVGSFLSERDLNKIFTNEQVEKGIIEHLCQDLEKDVESCCANV